MFCFAISPETEALAARENGSSSISIYRLDEGPKGQEVTSSDLVEGLTFVRTMFRELGEELLSFNRDEVEVSDTETGIRGPPVCPQ